MPPPVETSHGNISEFETGNNVDSNFLEEDKESRALLPPNYLRDNLSDIALLVILSSLAIFNYFIEAKLAYLNFFYIVILGTGFVLGKRFDVLSAFLTILIVWAFILADKVPYLVAPAHEVSNSYMVLWSGFLILTAWLGSAMAQALQEKTKEELKA
jgi:hypothetical protein